ncbi:glycosyltransferase [Dermacoccus barathri]
MMRIAVLATNRNPLVAPFAGGQEALTAALVEGFRRRGHHVVLHAAPGTPDSLADEVITYPELPRLSEVAALDPQVPEAPFLADHHAFTSAMSALIARRDIDVVANHSLHHLPMSLSPALAAPVVTTLHTPPFPWMELGAALAAPSARYVAVSRALAAQWTTVDARVVLNGADPEAFTLGPGAHDGALAWVGRITPEKAPHLAAVAARLAGRPLRLVGPVSDRAYFESQVAPLLGNDITHLGSLGSADIASVLGSSDALLVTPVWEEPFGLVAVEASLCGTPVIALERGGVREAVTEATGVLVPDGPGTRDEVRVAALVQALGSLRSFDRRAVRAEAERRFGVERLVDQHLRTLADATGNA